MSESTHGKMPHGCKSHIRGSRKICQRGSNFDDFFIIFLVDEGKKDQNTNISGPPSARQGNDIKMAFCWHADVGPTLNTDGDPYQYCLETLYFCDFLRGGSHTPVPPSGSARRLCAHRIF